MNFLLPYDRSFYHPEWQGGTLKVFDETPRRLNPLTDNSAITASVHSTVNDSLCDRTAATPDQWSELLATAVVIGDDYKTYTFTLRKGVMWQRPQIASQPQFAWLDKDVELTAEDFKFYLEMVMDPAVDCPSMRNYFEDFDHAEVPDPYTLRLVWKKKTFVSLAFSMGLSPLPRHIYGCDEHGQPIAKEKRGVTFNQHWFDERKGVVGVGAYILDDYVPDKVMRFRRNPGYWGAPLHFDAIEWNLEIKKPDAQLIAFKNGQVSVAGLRPLQYKSEIIDHKEPRFAAVDAANPKAGRSGELGWERFKAFSFSYLGWNMRRPLFKDKRVRQAMTCAFPKQRIIDEIFFGLGQPINSDVHPDSIYCNKDLKPFAFDVERAKALLAEAGWKDSDGDGVLDQVIDGHKQDFRFDVKYMSNSAEWDSALLIYKNVLRGIGVEMNPRPFEWKELMRVYEDKDFDSVVGAWTLDWDIDYFQLWHSSQAEVQGGSNHCGLVNKRVDELAVKLRETFDTAERIAIVKELQAILNEEQPYTFFRSGEGIIVWQNGGGPGQRLEGVTYGFDHLHPLRSRDRNFWHFSR